MKVNLMRHDGVKVNKLVVADEVTNMFDKKFIDSFIYICLNMKYPTALFIEDWVFLAGSFPEKDFLFIELRRFKS